MLQGLIRKHADNYRELVSLGASGGPPPGVPSPYEAGMKRIREYQDMCAQNQVQQQQQQQLRPQGTSALMEVMGVEEWRYARFGGAGGVAGLNRV